MIVYSPAVLKFKQQLNISMTTLKENLSDLSERHRLSNTWAEFSNKKNQHFKYYVGTINDTAL